MILWLIYGKVTYLSWTCHVWVHFATCNSWFIQQHLLRTESAKPCDDGKLYRIWKEAVNQTLWYCPTIFLEVLRKLLRISVRIGDLGTGNQTRVPPIQSCLRHDTAALSEAWEELGWETRPRKYAFVWLTSRKGLIKLHMLLFRGYSKIYLQPIRAAARSVANLS